MSCLHLYSDFAVHLRSRWIVSCLVILLRVWYAEGQNVNLQFPVFNESTFTCTGIPYVLGYATCFYTNTAGDAVEVLPPGYNNVYPNQAARFMYSSPIVFENPSGTVKASFSTFFVFSISHVANHSTLGGGFAFMIAPEINTPDNSNFGGFGMFPMDPKTGKSTSSSPMVMGVEFDTSLTPGIDTVPVPHIGIDITDLGGNSPASSNTTQITGTGLFDTPLGMWIDYNSTLLTISVYCGPVNGTDASAAGMKPDTPIVTMGDLRVETQLNRRSYVGFGAGVYGGGFEENLLYYWSFQTFGFPPASLLAQWYQWWAPLSTTAKVGLIAGAVVGTVGGAYLCSECLFFCFFKRIKHPQTEAEQRWPVRRRKSLPGTRTKRELPRKKVRDSLSVANPLHLWEAPLEPAEDPDGEAQESPAAGMPEEYDSSENEDTPLMSPPYIEEDPPDVEEDPPDIEEGAPDVEEGEQVQYEAEAMMDLEAMAKQVERTSRRASNRRQSTSNQGSTKSVPVQPPAEGKVTVNVVSIERTSTPAKRKSTPQVAKAPGSPPQQRRPSQAPRKPSQGVQGAKPSSGSPPQQRPSQTPRKPSQGVQGARPSSPPQQRPPQTPKAAKPTSPLKEGQSQGAKHETPQPGRKVSSPKTSPAAPQKSPPRGQRPSQVLNKESPKAPRPSPQTSPPKAAPRRPSRQASPKPVKPRPQPKSPKKNA